MNGGSLGALIDGIFSYLFVNAFRLIVRQMLDAWLRASNFGLSLDWYVQLPRVTIKAKEKKFTSISGSYIATIFLLLSFMPKYAMQ
jgi:hypothetical protein